MNFLEDLADLMTKNVFILHLVRDPRSMMRSWKFGKFEHVTGEKERAQYYCNRMTKDILFMQALRGTRLSRFHYFIRYEDMVYEPGYYIHSIYDAIGIPVTKEVSGGW